VFGSSDFISSKYVLKKGHLGEKVRCFLLKSDRHRNSVEIDRLGLGPRSPRFGNHYVSAQAGFLQRNSAIEKKSRRFSSTEFSSPRSVDACLLSGKVQTTMATAPPPGYIPPQFQDPRAARLAEKTRKWHQGRLHRSLTVLMF
jgi:hypothetical protein